MKKWLGLFLLFTSAAYASISVTPFTGEDNYFYYDVDVVLEGDKYVEGFSGASENGPGNSTDRTYYEWIYITPHSAGSDYSFINTSSSLQGSDGSTTDTQILFYDADTVDLTRVILDGPEIFNSSSTFGFGGSQSFENTGGPGIGNSSAEGPFAALIALEEEQYLMVVSSFQPNALGSIDIEIHGPDAITFASVPEPSTYALMIAFGSFLYVAIRRRHA